MAYLCIYRELIGELHKAVDYKLESFSPTSAHSSYFTPGLSVLPDAAVRGPGPLAAATEGLPAESPMGIACLIPQGEDGVKPRRFLEQKAKSETREWL